MSVPLPLTFQPPKHITCRISQDHPYPSLNTLGLFVFELCCGQTNKQSDKQTDGLERPTHADQQRSVSLVWVMKMKQSISLTTQFASITCNTRQD